jgi:hypothetical protein
LPDLFNHTNLPDSFRFPFKKDCIDMVTIQMISRADKTFIFQAWVMYRNGKTTGKQDFEGKDFKSLLIQIEDFINKMV